VDRSAASLLEAHVLDFDGDLYDAAVRVTFAAFLRGERKFDGVASLAAQLKLDVDHARTLLA
jgi:riboflavin kinase/FMN adenylyltransferase